MNVCFLGKLFFAQLIGRVQLTFLPNQTFLSIFYKKHRHVLAGALGRGSIQLHNDCALNYDNHLIKIVSFSLGNWMESSITVEFRSITLSARSCRRLSAKEKDLLIRCSYYTGFKKECK